MTAHPTTLESLKRKLDMSGGADSCWNWTGLINRRYGLISIKNRPTRAHRAMWMLTHGPIPKDMCVCHRCDNTLCCNPKHLFIGSVGDNNKDKIRKGRQAFGEKVSGSILKQNQVDEIRSRLSRPRRGEAADLARTYGVSAATISAIKNGRIWNSRASSSALGM